MAKFLVVRFSSIGDIVLTSPVVRIIKKQIPNSEVHFITKKKFDFLVKENPFIDKVYSIESAVTEVMDNLKKEKYSYIIDLHHNLRSLTLKKYLKVKSYTFSKLNYEKWMLVNFGIDKIKGNHVVDRYIDTLKTFKVSNDSQGLDYFIPESDHLDVNKLFKLDSGKYIAFVIGGTYQGKKMPSEKIRSICEQIQKPIVVLGGPDDKKVAEEVSTGLDHVVNTAGKFNFNQSASIIKQAEKVISHDTGLMHVASAFNKVIISAWGCTSPKLGMSPYHPHPDSVIVEPEGLKKRPCSKLGNRCKYPNWKCVHEIPEEQIIRAANL